MCDFSLFCELMLSSRHFCIHIFAHFGLLFHLIGVPFEHRLGRVELHNRFMDRLTASHQ